MAPPPEAPKALPRVLLALVVSVLSGVLLAGIALPPLAGVGLAAKATADDFLALPTTLDTPALSTRTRVLANDGSVIAQFYRVNRIAAPFEKIPVVMRQAIIAIEDSRFYEHNGVDYKGTLRAAVENARSGRVSQGGSTLTQQYVKNALVEASYDNPEAQKAATADSVERKLKEARYALALEQQLTKDEILYRYLEIAYFGNGVYGVGTAASAFFGKPVEQLTLPESALLAGVVREPTYYDVDSTDPAARTALQNRRDTVLRRMTDLGNITEAQRAEAAATPLPTVTVPAVGSDCGAPEVVAAFFCDYVRYELQETPVGAALGATREERIQRLFNGGLTVQTTLDPRVQGIAQRVVDEQVPNGDPSGVAAAANIVEPGTGAIRAMAVDRPYGENVAAGQTQVNLATGGKLGVQSGSTFKPFLLAAALQQGIPVSTTFVSPPSYVFQRGECKGTKEKGKAYTVNNAGDSQGGTFDLRTGTWGSVNTFYAQLQERVPLEKMLTVAESLGLATPQPDGSEKPLARGVCSSFLGPLGISPLDLAGAYGGFANRGMFCPVRAVLTITGPAGPLEVPPNTCKQVLAPGVADTVTSILTGVVTNGTGRGAAIGRPVAGKTGSATAVSAALFAGYTPQLAATVWLGNVPDPKPMQNIRINGRAYREVYGGTLPATIWRLIMSEVMKPYPVQGFAPADPSVVRGGSAVTGAVPDVSGLSYSEAVARIQAAGFKAASGKQVASVLRADRVVYTSPRSGRTAAPGSTVYIYRSTGVQPQPSLRPRPSARPVPTAPAPPPPPPGPPAPVPTG